jgi:hypothetical protein
LLPLSLQPPTANTRPSDEIATAAPCWEVDPDAPLPINFRAIVNSHSVGPLAVSAVDELLSLPAVEELLSESAVEELLLSLPAVEEEEEDSAQSTPHAVHRDHCTSVRGPSVSACLLIEMRTSIASCPGAGSENASLSCRKDVLSPFTYPLKISAFDAKVLVPSAQNRTR